jgi:hypothetical protein
MTAFEAYPVQPRDPSDIDEHLWLGEAEFHQGYEALTSSEQLRLVAMGGKERKGLFQ